MISKEEIENNNTFKISIPLITDEEIRNIGNNFEDIVNEFTKSYVKEKDLALEQYIMQKQQDKISKLESDKQKLIDKLEEKQKEIDDLNQFYETYEINYEGQAVLIDRNKFKEVIGADKGFSILVVNALPSIEEN